ncbi:MAG: C39 family peptidase [Gammaproteobacteria bacterium]|nr:C39 family peptidase [Gammaproteobacteria bacterium]
MLEQRQHQVVLQRWDLSCGAAALATILEYQHGDVVSEKEIAMMMMGRAEYLDDPSIVASRQGFSLLDLKKFVDERGYNGVGLGQMRLEDLVEYSPIIVPISIHGYQHFVIVRGMLNNRIVIADPAFGNRTMTKNRFERSWLPLPELGRIGFYVKRTDGLIPPNRLQVTPRDFFVLR